MNENKSSKTTKLGDLKDGLYITPIGKEGIITCFYHVGFTLKLNDEEIMDEIVKKACVYL